jgi:hypothetical protein
MDEPAHDPVRPMGLIARFDTPLGLLEACERMRDEGYTRWDAHSPYPVHGIDQAMGLPRSRLPWVVLALALTGACLGMLMQWWISAVDFPLVISAKPFFSWQAFIPVTFELTILLGAIGALLGMLGFNRLPRLHNWVFDSQHFERVSDDAFFVSVEAADPKFDPQATSALLSASGAVHVEVVRRP